MKTKREQDHAAIIQAIRNGHCTARNIAKASSIVRRGTVHLRITELLAAGVIETTGEERNSHMGRPAIQYGIVAEPDPNQPQPQLVQQHDDLMSAFYGLRPVA